MEDVKELVRTRFEHLLERQLPLQLTPVARQIGTCQCFKEARMSETIARSP